jgi:hypothetical protein
MVIDIFRVENLAVPRPYMMPAVFGGLSMKPGRSIPVPDAPPEGLEAHETAANMQAPTRKTPNNFFIFILLVYNLMPRFKNLIFRNRLPEPQSKAVNNVNL